MITREQVMEYFRSNKQKEQMSKDDRQEIALSCLDEEDTLYEITRGSIERFECKVTHE